MAEPGMAHWNRRIGEPLGGSGRRDVARLRRRRLLAVGTVVDDHRKPRGLRLRDLLDGNLRGDAIVGRSEVHTSELQSLMRISYAVFCLKKRTTHKYIRLSYTFV